MTGRTAVPERPEMAERLSTSEVRTKISEHREHAHTSGNQGRDRAITLVEAALLAVVALLAAWSGFASSKWSTESRLTVAQASTARIEANRATGLDSEALAFDTSTFNTWFSAYL